MRIKIFSNKIRNKLFLTYLFTFTSLIVILSTILISILSKMMVDEIGTSRLDLLKQIGERSNVIKNTSITISNLYKINSSLLLSLKESLSKEEEKSNKAALDEMKKNYDVVFSEVGIAYDVVVVGDNGFCYSSQAGDNYDFKSLQNQLWYRFIDGTNDDIIFISSFQDLFGTKKQQYVFSASRRIIDEQGENLGTLMINIDESYLSAIYQSALNGSNRIYIVDSNGNVISHMDKHMRGMNFINIDNFRRYYGINEFHIFEKSKENYLITSYYDQQTGWTIIEEMPSSTVFSGVYRAYGIIFVIIGVCFLIAILVSYYISKKVSKPLLNLCDSMNQVKRGNFDIISKVNGYEEIDELRDSFNSMAHEIKELLEDIKRKEAYKMQTERELLKAQINPHFLYNTLFSIKCLVEIGKKTQVIDMITAFIDLLKMTLRQDVDLIPLRDELEITEKYLILQQIRYGEKLSFEYEIDDITLNCLVPALLLQPLVENAIFHGIEAKEDAGIIIITSKIRGERLDISIIDDGVGMEKKKQREIEKNLQEKQYVRNKAIGIANVSNRIKADFGDEYGICIESERSIGTTVLVELPIKWNNRRDNDYENIDC